MSRLLSILLVAGALVMPLAAQTPTQARVGRPARAAEAKSSDVVNLNTATAAELSELPGVGAKTAARIIDYRQKKGSFKKAEELMNVQGIGEKSFLRMKSRVTVGGKDEPSATR